MAALPINAIILSLLVVSSLSFSQQRGPSIRPFFKWRPSRSTDEYHPAVSTEMREIDDLILKEKIFQSDFFDTKDGEPRSSKILHLFHVGEKDIEDDEMILRMQKNISKNFQGDYLYKLWKQRAGSLEFRDVWRLKFDKDWTVNFNHLPIFYIEDEVRYEGSGGVSVVPRVDGKLSKKDYSDSISDKVAHFYVPTNYCFREPAQTRKNKKSILGTRPTDTRLTEIFITNEKEEKNNIFQYNAIKGRQVPKNVMKVEVVEGIQSIPEKIFENCESLVEICLPSTLTSIGESAFFGCINLKTINLCEGIMSIPDNAFLDCKSLVEICLPSTITSIGKCAFYGCNKLQTINLPNGLLSIGYCAFGHCYELNHVVIPETLQSYGGPNPFFKCDKVLSDDSFELPYAREARSSTPAQLSHEGKWISFVKDNTENRPFLDGVKMWFEEKSARVKFQKYLFDRWKLRLFYREHRSPQELEEDFFDRTTELWDSETGLNDSPDDFELYKRIYETNGPECDRMKIWKEEELPIFVNAVYLYRPESNRVDCIFMYQTKAMSNAQLDEDDDGQIYLAISFGPTLPYKFQLMGRDADEVLGHEIICGMISNYDHRMRELFPERYSWPLEETE